MNLNTQYKAWIIFIGLGILFGIIATYKMGSGKMEKDLLKNKRQCEDTV